MKRALFEEIKTLCSPGEPFILINFLIDYFF